MTTTTIHRREVRRIRSVRLVQEVLTRLWSTYDMIDRSYQLRERLFNVYHIYRDTQSLPSEHDWNIIKELLQLLRPFKEATKLLEGEHVVTLSTVFPVLFRLEMFCRGKTLEMKNLPDWSQCSAEVNGVRKKIVEEMKKENRFNHFPDVMQLATVLDPRYKDFSFVIPSIIDEVRSVVWPLLEKEAITLMKQKEQEGTDILTIPKPPSSILPRL